MSDLPPSSHPPPQFLYATAAGSARPGHDCRTPGQHDPMAMLRSVIRSPGLCRSGSKLPALTTSTNIETSSRSSAGLPSFPDECRSIMLTTRSMRHILSWRERRPCTARRPVAFAAFLAMTGAVMIRLPDHFLAAGATPLASTASAAPVRERARGTATAISGDLLTVQRPLPPRDFAWTSSGSHLDCRSSFRAPHPGNGCCRQARPAHPRRRA